MKQKDFGWLLILSIIVICAFISKLGTYPEYTHSDLDTDGVVRQYTAPDHNNRPVAARDYQIEVTNDSIYMYDGNRLVTTMLFTDDSAIGQAIIGDNE